jgi:hypothetical protein
MISDAELAEIEVRAEKANPGPWSFGASYEVWRMEPWGARRIAEVSKVPNDTEDAQGRYDTVDFIAHARQDVPALVGSLRESQSEVRRLRTALELLSNLKTAAGNYIDCDERPRTPELWTAMCEATSAAAAWFNTEAIAQIGEGTD